MTTGSMFLSGQPGVRTASVRGCGGGDSVRASRMIALDAKVGG